MLSRLKRTKQAAKSAADKELLRHLPDIRRHAQQLRRIGDQHLLDASAAVRESFSAGLTDERETISVALALSTESLRRTQGVELYDVQLMAALAVAQGKVAEMATGEGKTYAVFPGAVIAALRGNHIHVATPNCYLAERDHALLAPAFEALGLAAGLLGDHNASIESKRVAYDADVTYGTGFDFGFDFLRDQAAARFEAQPQLGLEILQKLRGQSSFERKSMQRGHQTAIVDEIDHVLLDDAGSPLILCNAPDGEAEDAEACRLARFLLKDLETAIHFKLTGDANVHLQDAGIDYIHGAEIPIPVKQLRRPWTEYIQQALRAEFIFRRDVHYLVEEDEIKIVDGATGRIYSDRSWNDGLHQAIEAKEGVTITDERSALAQITRQRYFRLYEQLAGMTGTAVGCEQEFKQIYKLEVWPIPLRSASRRITQSTRVFSEADPKWKAIADDVRDMHQTGRPILVGTRTIRESESLAQELSDRKLPFQLLNGKQDKEEAEIVAEAGLRGTITIATNLAGRGTDIKLTDEVRNLGGLHVVVTEPNELQRVDRQLVGRCARQGDPGSCRMYVSAEDNLIRMYGPWLAAPIVRCSRDGELHLDISKRLQSVQALVERKRAAGRLHLMQRDLARESLLGGISKSA